jgi:hypothetical protein
MIYIEYIQKQIKTEREKNTKSQSHPEPKAQKYTNPHMYIAQPINSRNKTNAIS